MTRANYDQLLEDARSGRSIAVVLWRGQSLETATDHLVATGKHLDLVVRATAMMFTAGMATDDDGLRYALAIAGSKRP